VTAPIVKKGLVCQSFDNFGHKGAAAAYRSAGFYALSADSSLVTGQTPPYGTYALKLDFNKAAYLSLALLTGLSDAANPNPTLGTIPITRYVHLMKHTTAHPSTTILVINYITSPVFQSDTIGFMAFKLNTAGKLEFWGSGAVSSGTLSLIATGVTVMTLNAWYYIEHMIRKEGSTYHHIVRLYDSTGAFVATDIDVAGRPEEDKSRSGVQYGEVNAGAAGSRGCEVYFGPLYGAFEDGAADLLKPTIRRLTPTGDGTYGDWAGRPYGAAAVTVVSSTNATPISINAVGHGFANNNNIEIAGHGLNLNANGIHNVQVVDANNFTLDGTVGTAAGTGGTARLANPAESNWDELATTTPDGTTYTISGGDTDTADGNHLSVGSAYTKRQTSAMSALTANDLPYFLMVQAWNAGDSTKGNAPWAIIYNGTLSELEGNKSGSTATLTYMSWPYAGNLVFNDVPGGTGWTLAQVDALEAGVKVVGSGGNTRERMSAIWMDVAVNANEANWQPFPVASAQQPALMGLAGGII
jgi:hypothetical protein